MVREKQVEGKMGEKRKDVGLVVVGSTYMQAKMTLAVGQILKARMTVPLFG
jgi:hypothetical protein